MALIKFGGGVEQMSGSIAGNTFARNRFGNYVRSRTKPVNPRSSRQTGARATIMMLAEQWRESPMTDAMRTAWNVYANAVSWVNKLGETIKLTGFNHYIRGNAVKLRVGASIVIDGPVDLGLPAGDPTISCSASEATQLITVTFDDTAVWCDEDAAYLVMEMGEPQNPTRQYFGGPWRYSASVEGDSVAPPTSPQTMAPAWVLTEGQKIWTRFSVLRADARLSTKFEADPILVGA